MKAFQDVTMDVLYGGGQKMEYQEWKGNVHPPHNSRKTPKHRNPETQDTMQQQKHHQEDGLFGMSGRSGERNDVPQTACIPYSI